MITKKQHSDALKTIQQYEKQLSEHVINNNYTCCICKKTTISKLYGESDTFYNGYIDPLKLENGP